MFQLCSDRSRLPTRWIFLRFNLTLGETFPFQPALYIQERRRRTHVIDLPFFDLGRGGCVLRFPNTVRELGLRVVGPNPDPERLSAITADCWELSNVSLLAMMLMWPGPGRWWTPWTLVGRSLRGVGGYLRGGVSQMKHQMLAPYRRQFTVRNMRQWYERYRQDSTACTSGHRLHLDEAKITYLVYCDGAEQEQLHATIDSLSRQEPNGWEAILLTSDAAAMQPFARGSIRLLNVSGQSPAMAFNRAIEQAGGRYVTLLAPGEGPERHALARLCEVIDEYRPDVLYTDGLQILAGDHVTVTPKPGYSYDRLLCDPKHLRHIFLRTGLAREVGCFCEEAGEAGFFDLLLRVLERAARVCHLPEILFRVHGRDEPVPPGRDHQRAIDRHLGRLGYPGRAEPGLATGLFRVRFFDRVRRRVAIIVPTKNQGKLLRKCIESVVATVPRELFDLWILDHE